MSIEEFNRTQEIDTNKVFPDTISLSPEKWNEIGELLAENMEENYNIDGIKELHLPEYFNFGEMGLYDLCIKYKHYLVEITIQGEKDHFVVSERNMPFDWFESIREEVENYMSVDNTDV